MKKTYFTISLLILIAIALLITIASNTSDYDLILQNNFFHHRISNILSTSTVAISSNDLHFSLTVPKNYQVAIAGSHFNRLRFMTMSPDKKLFVTDLHDVTDNTKGKIYVLSDFNTSSKTFASTSVYLDNLHNPNSVAFYKDTTNVWWIYIAETDKLTRYKYTPGDSMPGDSLQVLATFPSYGNSAANGGWHLTRTLAIHNNKIYVSVGSSCDSCEEKTDEVQRATIVEMDPDGSNQRIYASGLRNAVGLKWAGNSLFATDMGVDHLGDDVPNDMFYKIADSRNYGWPYCYASHGKVMQDSTQPWTHQNISCDTIPAPYSEFEAHAAPLGLEFFDSTFADTSLRDSFLVALHGSGNPKIGTGNKIVKINSQGIVSDFITGFHTASGSQRFARPVDILRYDTHSFFFTDDSKGVLYYVYLK